VVAALIVAGAVTPPAALARAGPLPEHLVFSGPGPLRQDGSREHLGSSTDPWGGAVYLATIEGDSGPTPIAPGRFIGTSPDAQTLYVNNGDEVRAIRLGSKQPGTILLTESEHWCMYPKVSPSGAMLAYHDGQSSVIVRPLRRPAKRITVTNDIGTNSMFYWITRPPTARGASPSGREASER